MAKILWLNWSGGGNLPPSLGIARALTERGHEVSFAGRPEMVARVEAAGFRAIEIKSAYAQADRYPASLLRNAGCYLTSPACAAEVRGIVDTEGPDLVLIDAMFPAALASTRDLQCPTAVVCHTFLFQLHDKWREMLARLNGMRTQAGFEGLPGADELWQAHDRIIVTTLASFDAKAPAGWDRVRHVGPVLEDEKVAAVPVELPWADDDATPLALMSFSTGFEQRSVDKMQRGLDALADLPIHVVATTGGIVDPGELRAPANAVVLNYAAHDPILRRASLVVTHGGHGTAMRALRHGVPMIVIPGLAHDQAPNAATLQQWGVGVALPESAEVDAIRDAAQRILSTPSYRQQAQQRAGALAGVDGATNAAKEIEKLIATWVARPPETSASAVAL